ncbi:chaplin [Streptomyces sp. NRRL S-87]|uniref:chaplin n=1 Tax=Streptomyces sp. NRRL S-87 TaxID=1463920 RepID=UPI0004BF0308|nr:chaplin [Streptomyces sp. NRRL S-87]
MIAVAAASGVMAMAGSVYADSAAEGASKGSPGLLSGNGIQLPVHVPVSACGNTVNVVGLLNPAMGNRCANQGGGAANTGSGAHESGSSSSSPSATSSTSGGAKAGGAAEGSPGVITGNGVQLPVRLPVNVSGNTVNVVGVANPVFGNESVNGPGGRPEEPVQPKPPTVQKPPAPEVPTVPPKPAVKPPVKTAPHEPPTVRTLPRPVVPTVRERRPVEALAHTGADGTVGAAAATSLAALLAGGLLFRRFGAPAAGRRG